MKGCTLRDDRYLHLEGQGRLHGRLCDLCVGLAAQVSAVLDRHLLTELDLCRHGSTQCGGRVKVIDAVVAYKRPVEQTDAGADCDWHLLQLAHVHLATVRLERTHARRDVHYVD